MFSAWARGYRAGDCLTSGWLCRCFAERAYGGASFADVVCAAAAVAGISRGTSAARSTAWPGGLGFGAIDTLERASALWTLADYTPGGMARDEPNVSWLACAWRVRLCAGARALARG